MTSSLDPKIGAAIAMLRRTGAVQVQIRFSDDEQPVVWVGIAIYPDGHWESGSGANPATALVRCCERVVDGGTCQHCGRPTGFDDDPAGAGPLDAVLCWYRWDPELATFRRTCEGMA